MSELESELERRTVTFTSWNLSATKMENKAWHPFTFNYADACPKKIKEIKVIDTNIRSTLYFSSTLILYDIRFNRLECYIYLGFSSCC